jgi:hypothetical protein
MAAASAALESDVRMLGPALCPWLSESGQLLLNRSLDGPLSFSQATVAEIVKELHVQRHVPLSFIETEAAPKLTFSTSDTTVRGLLDHIVAMAPVLRYRFVGARLVLYPVDPLWDLRLDDLRLAAGKRRWVGEAHTPIPSCRPQLPAR